jgi:hypothetical protein
MAGTGYKDPYIPLTFPELADGCSVLIRNPQLMSPALMERAAAMADGEAGIRSQAMNDILAYLIVAWRNVFPVEDDLSDVVLDGDEPIEDLLAKLQSRERQPLGKPSPETVAQMPMTIMLRVAEQIKDVANPQ